MHSSHARRAGDSARILCRSEDLLMETMENKFWANVFLKEPKFFNRWPLPDTEAYIHAWDTNVTSTMLAGRETNKVLVDASPQYLMVPNAALRVKAAVPHAKFVVVVRVRPSNLNLLPSFAFFKPPPPPPSWVHQCSKGRFYQSGRFGASLGGRERLSARPASTRSNVYIAWDAHNTAQLHCSVVD
jgi:hypothetical protein